MDAPILHFLDNDGFILSSRPAQAKPTAENQYRGMDAEGASPAEQSPAPVEYMTDALGAVLIPLPDADLPEHILGEARAVEAGRRRAAIAVGNAGEARGDTEHPTGRGLLRSGRGGLL